MADKPTSSPRLQFNSALPKKELEKIRDNVSAIVVDGSHLWLGGDEGTSIHRMTRDASGNFGDHTSFELKGTLNLPGPAKEEIDIEGLDVDGGYLWLIGSHSAKRKKAEADKSDDENLDRLTRIDVQGNRFTLARVPIDGTATPVRQHGGLTAARLQGHATANLITETLTKDRHLGRFVPRVSPDGSVDGVPSKDNGFDIEGLAVTDNRVFFGLRGPVLRGWAAVIELQVAAAPDQTLTLDAVGSDRRPYIKHLLQLDGLGIRELVMHGDDLLVLSGPSMDLDGPVFIYRWKGALNLKVDSLTWNTELTKLVTVPYGASKDHAEGLSFATKTPLSVMVCYDSPAEARIDGSYVKTDVFAIGA